MLRSWSLRIRRNPKALTCWWMPMEMKRSRLAAVQMTKERALWSAPRLCDCRRADRRRRSANPEDVPTKPKRSIGFNTNYKVSIYSVKLYYYRYKPNVIVETCSVCIYWYRGGVCRLNIISSIEIWCVQKVHIWASVIVQYRLTRTSNLL